MRTTAALATAVAALHVWVLAAHAGPHGLWLSAALLVMTAVCLKCALGLWRARSPRARRAELTAMLAISSAMALAHAALMLGLPGLGGAHAGHGAMVAGSAAGVPSSSLMMLALIPLEIVVAAAAAAALRRLALRQPVLSPDA
ncbi:hypothetical protein [Zhihengliuella salsuginis]|uniref:Integral membrane protein n=1 Tax=Zhihengliuella salsuginis TaxID=578222 RepID=A0ABQ3GCC0_9MICC|nr:hypothetical protein [Zhihengliuella salsuginis]GHD00420.1 hypothetical protein GCM10008096_03710 [Zhihengliuella salsuginis]